MLDTNIVSNLRKARPHPNLIAWLLTVQPSEVFMTSTTICEIQCGIAQSPNREIAGSVQNWLDGMLKDGCPLILDFDAEAARILGRMWADPSLDNFVRTDPRSTKRKSGADLAIAATAIVRDMMIVTDNVTDFELIGRAFALPGLINPLAGTAPT
jgi:predicted nucleic acid-binding protein